MYNVLFTMKVITHTTDESTALIARSGADWCDRCAGMRTLNGAVPFMAIVPNEPTLLAIKSVLDTLGETAIIGVWDNHGLQQGYHSTQVIDGDNVTTVVSVNDDHVDEDGDITPAVHFHFDKVLYMAHLNDIVTHDDEGNILSSVRPVEPVQVQGWSGWEPRDLTEYGGS